MSGLNFYTPSVSFTPFRIQADLPAEVLVKHLLSKDEINEQSVPSVGISGNQQVYDPISVPGNTPQSLVDHLAKFNVVLVDRTPPKSLVKAEVDREIKARLRATNKQFLSRDEKKEIKESVLDRLEAEAQLSYQLTEVAIDLKAAWMLVGASGDTAIDRVFLLLAGCVKACPIFTVGEEFNNWKPVSFHAKASTGELFSSQEWVIPEFMMFLWYSGLKDYNFGLHIEATKPVVFRGRGDDGENGEVRLSHSRNVYTAEASQAVVSGKLLTKATFMHGDENDGWYLTMNQTGHLAFKFVSKDAPHQRSERFTHFYDLTVKAMGFLMLSFQIFKRERAKKNFSADMHEVAEEFIKE